MKSPLETAPIAAPHASALSTSRRLVSNSLFALAALCGVLAVVVALRSESSGPGLSAQAALVDLGEVAQGDRVPLTFKLLNRTQRPIRMLGADEP